MATNDQMKQQANSGQGYYNQTGFHPSSKSSNSAQFDNSGCGLFVFLGIASIIAGSILALLA